MAAFALVLIALPVASAQSEGTPAQRIDELVWILLILSIAIAGFVFVALLVALWLFREGSDRKRGTVKTHDTKLELVWTAIPAVIVAIIAFLSGQALLVIEEPPESGVEIEVVGHQWFWEFRYPDGRVGIGELWIEEGQTLLLDVYSEDVVHSFFIPDFSLKIDAFPDKVNHAWLVAEPAGNYSIACAEFCGVAHAQMRATMVVFEKGTQALPYGPPPDMDPPGPGDGDIVDVDLLEWEIVPAQLSLSAGQNVSLRIHNNGSIPHNLKLDAPYDLLSATIGGGGMTWLNFTVLPGTDGVAYWCDIAGHRGLGMEGALSVKTAVQVNVELFEWAIEPAQLEFNPGDDVSLRLVNTGAVPHNFKLDAPYDLLSETIGPGEVTWLNFTVLAGTESVAYWCDIPGHRALGMEGVLLTAGGAPPPPTPGAEEISPLAIALLILMGVAFLATLAAALRPVREESPAPGKKGGGDAGDE